MAVPEQEQLTLPVQLRDDATLDNFLASPEMVPLLCTLRQQLDPSGEAMVYLHGAAGTGKSHLLQASCHLAGSAAQYLPLAELASYRPEEVLHGIESLGLVCLDDVQAVLGDEAWEFALFTLYNRARQRNCRLVVAGNAAPRVLQVGLADLRSRLYWGPVYQLPQAADEHKAAILQLRAARRGLALAPGVSAYIVNRAERDLEPLLALLDILDRASLVEQRALSIPFVKRALGW